MITQHRGGWLSFLDHRRVKRLLGGPLPESATDLRLLIWQPSGDLAYHEALVRFDLDRAAYLAFVRSQGLALFADGGPDVHLPIDWSAPTQMQPPSWWAPSPDTPADAASARLGDYGSVATKWEDGHVYVFVRDTGHRSATGS